MIYAIIISLVLYGQHQHSFPHGLSIQTKTMIFPKELLIEALFNEYVWLCHDDYDPDVDIAPEDYLTMLKDMTYDQLVEETDTDEIFTLAEYVEAWG